jgi:transposase
LSASKEQGRTFRRDEIAKNPICFIPHLYRAPLLIERFFNKIKQCRRLPTRYDKAAANYHLPSSSMH